MSSHLLHKAHAFKELMIQQNYQTYIWDYNIQINSTQLLKRHATLTHIQVGVSQRLPFNFH